MILRYDHRVTGEPKRCLVEVLAVGVIEGSDGPPIVSIVGSMEDLTKSLRVPLIHDVGNLVKI